MTKIKTKTRLGVAVVATVLLAGCVGSNQAGRLAIDGQTTADASSAAASGKHHGKPHRRKAHRTRQAKGGGAVRTAGHATLSCLPASVRSALRAVSKRYGKVTISSTRRSRKRNRRAGGARHSMHLACRAADFRIHGRSRRATTFLRKRPGIGGVKRYRNGLYHIDNGPKRSW
jgi:uncharacterized protein YcbK (DUF882 family)